MHNVECFTLLLFRILWNKIDRSFPRKWRQTIQSTSTTLQIRKVPGTHPSWIPAGILLAWKVNFDMVAQILLLCSKYLMENLPLLIHETMIAILWPNQEWFYPETPLPLYRNYQNCYPVQLLEFWLIPVTVAQCWLHWLWHSQRDPPNCSRPMSYTSVQNISTSVLAPRIAVWPHINSKILMQSKKEQIGENNRESI